MPGQAGVHQRAPEGRAQRLDLDGMRRMGVRRRPLFGFLPRHHLLNRFTGRLSFRTR